MHIFIIFVYLPHMRDVIYYYSTLRSCALIIKNSCKLSSNFINYVTLVSQLFNFSIIQKIINLLDIIVGFQTECPKDMLSTDT